MLAPIPILPDDPPALLGDVRLLLSANPGLAGHPARLAECLAADEQAVVHCLELLMVENEVLA